MWGHLRFTLNCPHWPQVFWGQSNDLPLGIHFDFVIHTEVHQCLVEDHRTDALAVQKLTLCPFDSR